MDMMTGKVLLFCVPRDVQIIIYRYLHQYHLNACFKLIFTNMYWADDVFRWICIEGDTYSLVGDNASNITGLFQHRTPISPNVQIYKIIIDTKQFIRQDYNVPIAV